MTRSRLVFLALLAGGLIVWSQLRKPREVKVEIDLTQALPGEIVEVDVIVRRGETALVRRDEHYGAHGAPGLLTLELRAASGAAEVETTLVRTHGPAQRTLAQVKLAEDAPARVVAPLKP